MSVCIRKLRRPEGGTRGLIVKRQGQAAPRAGFSLLEAVMAITLSALLMTPVVGILQSGRGIYEDLQQQQNQLDGVYGTLRHVSRQLRTAQRVLSIRTRGQRLTILEIVGSDGQVCLWRHDRRSGRITFEKAGVSSLLADQLSTFELTALDASGQPAPTASSIRTLRCTVTTQLSGNSHALRSATCSVWIRPQ